MRVISQTGKTDVPYENFVFSIIKISGGNYGIVAVKNVAEPPEVFLNSLIATYSTKEKAIKAMEILREQYSRIEIIKALASGTCKHMEESLKPEEFKDILKKYINMEVFQFPQDDEIEV
jgi:hypothetical protein